MPSAKVVQLANEMPLIRYYKKSTGEKISNAAHTGFSAVTLALAAYTGDASVDSKVLSQARLSIAGANEPFSAGGYYAQHERLLTGFFSILKKTPRLWNQLSAAEIKKIDLIMKASLIASAFTTSDNSYYIRNNQQQRALDGDTNLNRNWNPNYREGMIGGVLVGMAYFGGPQAADAILDNYNHAAFVSELQQNELVNIHETFTANTRNTSAPSGSRIEESVRSYRYMGSSLSNYKAIYLALTRNTFNKIVSCGLNNGAGIDGGGKIITACNTLPNLGKKGMLNEFDSVDANGKRSSAAYAYDGYRPAQVNQLVLIIHGFWNKDDVELKQLVREMDIGVEDLHYKLTHGYRDYHKGMVRDVKSYDNLSPDYGFRYTLPIWFDILSAFHGI